MAVLASKVAAGVCIAASFPTVACSTVGGVSASLTASATASSAAVAQRGTSALDFGRRDDNAERWAFDTNGYLLIEDVMDDEWIDAAMAGIDANLEHMIYRGAGDKLDGDVTLAEIPGAPTISGTGRPDLKDLFQLPPPQNNTYLKKRN